MIPVYEDVFTLHRNGTEEVCKHNVSRGVENIEILLKVKIQNVKNTMASPEKDT